MQNNSGSMNILKTTTFHIILKADVYIESLEPTSTNGEFKITIKTTTPNLVSKIQVPMWRDSDQNDLVWYNTSQIDDNTYQVIIDIAKHKYHIGNFNIHIYATLKNEVRHLAFEDVREISVSDYAYVERIGLGKYTLNILNPNGGNVEQVKIPTWSETNGQDDLVWYNATYKGNGLWSATLNTGNHKHAGLYNMHYYAVINGVQIKLLEKTYNIPANDMLFGMNLKAQNYRSSTNKLILVDLTNHRVGVYSGSYQNWSNIQSYVCTVGAPSTPTITGEFSIYMKRIYFDSGSSRCFYFSPFKGGYGFHSVLYYQDSSPQRIMDGRLGMDLSHGCVRLDVNNAKWIYDNCPVGTKVVVYK